MVNSYHLIERTKRNYDRSRHQQYCRPHENYGCDGAHDHDG